MAKSHLKMKMDTNMDAGVDTDSERDTEMDVFPCPCSFFVHSHVRVDACLFQQTTFTAYFQHCQRITFDAFSGLFLFVGNVSTFST
jgi:hypothetical protein